jgi:hypothetical protein
MLDSTGEGKRNENVAALLTYLCYVVHLSVHSGHPYSQSADWRMDGCWKTVWVYLDALGCYPLEAVFM